MINLVFLVPPRRFLFPARADTVTCGSFVKDPTEQFPVGIDWARRLPSGRTIGLITLSAIDTADNSAAAVLLHTRGTSEGSITYATVMAGVIGHRYKIVFDVTDEANGHYRQALLMIVRAA